MQSITSRFHFIRSRFIFLQKKSPKADENIRSIKNDLAVAINSCIEAAGYETSYSLQRNLLKAKFLVAAYLKFIGGFFWKVLFGFL
jgi:hypothetical protein